MNSSSFSSSLKISSSWNSASRRARSLFPAVARFSRPNASASGSGDGDLDSVESSDPFSDSLAEEAPFEGSIDAISTQSGLTRRRLEFVTCRIANQG